MNAGCPCCGADLTAWVQNADGLYRRVCVSTTCGYREAKTLPPKGYRRGEKT